MTRSAIEELDAKLRAVGVNLDDDDEIDEIFEASALRDGPRPALLLDDPDDIAEEDWSAWRRPLPAIGDDDFADRRTSSAPTVGPLPPPGALAARRSNALVEIRNDIAELREIAIGRMPPMVIPAGYKRDRRGTWRYAHSGRSVPGARDLTIDTLHPWGRQRDPNWVTIPVDAAREHPELEWAMDEWSATRPYVDRVLGSRKPVEVILVPRRLWRIYGLVSLGIDAPELLVHRMIDLGEVARRCGVERKTITSYRARGQMPSPQTMVAGAPLWSAPIIDDWVASRAYGLERRRRSSATA